MWAALPAWPLSQFQFSHCRIRGHTSSARVHSDGRWQRLVRSGEPANVARHPALGSAAAGASPVTAAIAAACSRHRRTYTPGGSRARKWRACAAAAGRDGGRARARAVIHAGPGMCRGASRHACCRAGATTQASQRGVLLATQWHQTKQPAPKNTHATHLRLAQLCCNGVGNVHHLRGTRHVQMLVGRQLYAASPRSVSLAGSETVM